REPARTLVSIRAPFGAGRAQDRAAQKMKTTPRIINTEGREGTPIVCVAAIRISKAPRSSTMNSLSKRKRLAGALIAASPRGLSLRTEARANSVHPIRRFKLLRVLPFRSMLVRLFELQVSSAQI